jgi:hypothetical protein
MFEEFYSKRIKKMLILLSIKHDIRENNCILMILNEDIYQDVPG